MRQAALAVLEEVSVARQTVTIDLAFAIENCCARGMTFAVTSDFQNRRLADHKSYYCPNGHSQHYTGESEADKLRRTLKEQESATKKAEYNAFLYKQDFEREHEQHTETRRQLTTTKGQLTKTKKRIAGGTCPACNRSFVELQKHMATKHPEYTTEELAP